MTVALLVIGNGRLDYLHRAVDSALQHLPALDHHLMIDDSGDATVRRELARNYPDFLIQSHEENLGMANAVNQGFKMCCETDADYVFWLEEDMVILKSLPILDMINVLERHPYVAQMLLQRQPLTPEEHESGSVAQTLLNKSTHGKKRVTPDRRGISFNDWIQQDSIFSLNPGLIPRAVLELGWPTGNEAEMTNNLLAKNWLFGVWTDGAPHVEHIGVERGAKWQL